MSRIRKEILIAAQPQRIYDLLIRYQQYPEFMPELRSVKILRQQDPIDLVEFTAFYLRTMRYTLKILRHPHRGISWEQVRGDFKKNSGSWHLIPAAAGKTRAIYSLDLQVPFLVPPPVFSALAQVALPRMMNRFRSRAEATLEDLG